MASGSLVCKMQTPSRSSRNQREPHPGTVCCPPAMPRPPRLTIDREVDPAAVVEGVVLLVQHEDFALVPALVLGADLLNAQGGFVVQAGPPCGENSCRHHGLPIAKTAPHHQSLSQAWESPKKQQGGCTAPNSPLVQ